MMNNKKNLLLIVVTGLIVVGLIVYGYYNKAQVQTAPIDSQKFDYATFITGKVYFSGCATGLRGVFSTDYTVDVVYGRSQGDTQLNHFTEQWSLTGNMLKVTDGRGYGTTQIQLQPRVLSGKTILLDDSEARGECGYIIADSMDTIELYLKTR